MNGRLENKIKTQQKINEKITGMPEYMEHFLYSIQSLTHNTQLRYINNAIRFLNQYGKGQPVSVEQLNNVSDFTIQKYLSDISYYEKDQEVCERKKTSEANTLSCLNAFFTFLYRADYIKKNPFEKGTIKYPKPEETEVIYLTAQEVKKVEKAIIDGVGTDRAKARQEKWKYRDFCLFWLPVCNGIRVSALSEINVEDIDFQDKSIKCIEKGNKHVRIYFDDKAAMYLRLWIERRRALLEDVQCDALFISNQRDRMTVRSIENLIEKYTFAAVGRKISPHKLRATFATTLYRVTRDVKLVADALHHKSTVPTKRYVDVFQEDVKNAINSNLYS